MVIDKNYVKYVLDNILKIPSPTGYTEEVMKFMLNEFTVLNINTYFTHKGALIATIPGKDNNNHRTLSAHVDTLGGMVKEIKSNGRLKLTQIGGYDWHSIEGEHCTIISSSEIKYNGTIVLDKASVHVHGSKADKSNRDENSLEVRVDEKVNSKKDIEKLGINIGDFISFDPRTIITENEFIKSRHLDDKAGVTILLGIAKYLKNENITPKYTTHFFISNYEEVGHGASASIPEKTFEFVAIDMAAVGEGQTSDEYKVTICAKDSSGPYDYNLRKNLVQLAKENELNYAVDIYPHYGSDASAALSAGWEFKHGLIGPGVDSSHGHERCHMDSIENTIKLGIAYLVK
ncbi:M42 family metallopeptidase [Clostridium sp. D2Q-14]|uniref:M42 family metallopeptidase n=1 Tax=Anaeromonas gelatinilytica TaxID=2683194 RepID=UPI00193B6CD2|nr:M42 family metallopeptidase [Anaeromonas gelatinilytica]MBS4534794.1 M42 family metallopeptidase [Anaeromonas gelatinilytica]